VKACHGFQPHSACHYKLTWPIDLKPSLATCPLEAVKVVFCVLPRTSFCSQIVYSLAEEEGYYLF
jgi:hypothetical protein